MHHDLRVQVLTLTNVSWSEMLRRFQWMEEIGVDVAAIGDHFVDWSGPEKPFFEAWTYLSAAAQATTSMRLTTCVTQLPLRNPAMLAHQAVSVDHISGGRLEVGLGTGLRIDPSNEMIGIENWSNAERVERFAEYVEIVHLLMSQPVSTFKGRYYSVEGAVTSPGPIQTPRPPIMVAAMGPKMLNLTARYADIWNSLSFSESIEEQLEQTSIRTAQIKGFCDDIGRDFSEIRSSFTMFDPKARSEGRAFAYYEDVDEFIRRANAVIDLGMSEISIYYPVLDSQVEAFEHIIRNVIPQMRAERKAG